MLETLDGMVMLVMVPHSPNAPPPIPVIVDGMIISLSVPE